MPLFCKNDPKLKKKFTFGPVPSRRLGKSLGVDIVPFKECAYDCIYCQLGRTTNKTTNLKEYCPMEDVILEVKEKLQRIPRPDYITLSGSGEPTLNCRIKEIIGGIKKITDIPVVVLTGGSLFWIDEVRDAMLDADLIVPSLDAGDEDTFLCINRPHGDISFKKMINGLCSLRKDYKGPIWLEVFLVGGVTDRETEIIKIKNCVDRIDPDKIQLNTAVRTPAENFVRIARKERMTEVAEFFGSRCEVIANYSNADDADEFLSTKDDVFELLKRRPCSIDDISKGLSLHRNEAIKYVQELLNRNFIGMKKQDDKTLYYVVNKNETKKET
jgi:wyosine [tRNA(Phe)-imidazoG37] synthetase (radical SAM superfamily)